MDNTNIKLKGLICSFFILLGINLKAQDLNLQTSPEKISLEECYTWARENFPLIKQMDMIDKTTQYSLSNASSGNLPQINLNGQATYQSDVTAIPIIFPNMDVPSVDKDQYKIYAEIYQPLSNFSNVKTKKEQIEIEGEIEKQKVEINLYQLKERINQIYFGSLLINEKIEQFEFIVADIDSSLAKIKAAIKNGTATETDKQMLYVERISILQQIEENKSNQVAFLKMLSMLTGKNIGQNTVLEEPTMAALGTEINRPELQLFKLQSDALHIQEKQVKSSLIPNIGLMAQGGYGKPGLNFLNSDFALYYIGGLKFNWYLSGFYNLKNTKKILHISKDKIALQKDVFLLNTSLSQSQQSTEITKFQTLLESDKEIIRIREEILSTAKVQLANGLITTIDYVKFLNDVNKAKQKLLLRKTQLLLAQYNLKTTSGN